MTTELALGELLERERETESLSKALDDAVAGDAAFVLVEGDPGVGKSSLLAHAARAAETRGFEVLRARGGMLERSLGWGVTRQLFEARVIDPARGDRRRLLRGSAALCRPVLGLPGQAETAAAQPVDRPFEHGLYWLTCNLVEERPAALVIDDVHWCDNATLGWLLYLARRSEHLQLAVLLAMRPAEPDAPAQLLQMLANEPVCRTLRLPALTAGATETLLQQAYEGSVDREFALACHRRTGGNPLFVRELARELSDEGIAPVTASTAHVETVTPPRVSRVIMVRLARVSPAALKLASATAVLDGAAETRFVLDLAELDEGVGAAALDELLAARVLTAERPLRFTHPLVGAVVYEDIPPARRASMHKRAARLLSLDGADPGWIAAQLLRAEPAGDEWVVEELVSAAERDVQRGSPATAVGLLRRALAEGPAAARLPVLLRSLGSVEALLGDPASIATLRRALELESDPCEQGEMALMLSRMLVGRGDAAEAVALLCTAADNLAWEQHAPQRLQLEAALVNAARVEVDTLAVIPERLRGALAHMDRDEHGGRLLAAQLSWGMTAIGMPVKRTVQMARRCLDGDGVLSAPEAFLGAAQMLNFADELDDAELTLGAAIDLARRSGSAANFAGASSFLAFTKYLRGDLAEAELCARDALRASAGLELPALELVRGLATAYLCSALVARGEPAKAAMVLAEGPKLHESARETWITELMFAAAGAAGAEERLDAAAELLRSCGRRALRWGVTNPAWLPWRSELALTLKRLGRHENAAELCEEELTLARRYGAPRPIGVALRAQALVGPREDSIELLTESAAVLGQSPSRLEYANTLVALGRALRQAQRRREARPPLTEGLELATRCGATPLAHDARSELAAIGARARLGHRTGADSLTASERRVCELAAAGKSNPEIAQLLFVTRATVESHLHSAYRRLDVSSRKQLADALAAAEPLDVAEVGSG